MTEEMAPTREQVAELMRRVFALVRACPEGRVTTYGWLGKALGYPRGARMIGWIMNEVSEGVPAQRVLNSKGELSGGWAFGPPGQMRKLLEAEGIVLSQAGDKPEHVDLKRYGWDPSHPLDLPPEELEQLLATALASTEPLVVSGRLMTLLRTDPASPLRPTSSA